MQEVPPTIDERLSIHGPLDHVVKVGAPLEAACMTERLPVEGWAWLDCGHVPFYGYHFADKLWK